MHVMGKKSKKAVSPMLAAALLIAITLAIAAVVASTTSMVPIQRPSPSATFSTEIKSGDDGYFLIEHLSGDPIQTEDLRIVLVTPDGTQHVVDPNSNNTFYNAYGYPQETTGESGKVQVALSVNKKDPGERIKVWLYDGTNWQEATYTNSTETVTKDDQTWVFRVFEAPSGNYTKVKLTNKSGNGVSATFSEIAIVDQYGMVTSTEALDLGDGEKLRVLMYEYTSPWEFKPGEFPSDNISHHFGQYTLSVGERAKGNELKKGSYENWGAPFGGVDDIRALFGDSWDSLSEGDVVVVKIVHVPTGKVIWNQEVTVH